MSLRGVVFRLELRELLRARGTWLVLGVWSCAGLLAIALGSSRVASERERGTALEPALTEQDHFLRTVAAPKDLGLYFYYLPMTSVHEPNAWSALATGLRDVHPTARHVRLLGLVPQLYQGEIENPRLRLAGRFDFAFVVVFLLPLVIIALGYDVRSRDEDLATEPLLVAQPAPLSRLLALRIGLRAGLVLATSHALLAVATGWVGLPIDARLAAFTAALIAYVLAWFLGLFLVVSLGRSSPFNALALVGGWIVACILLPATLELSLSRLAPVRGGVELVLAQRQEMNAGWDRPKRATLEPFVARHPEWAHVPVPEDRFSWPWYYAMHEQGDLHVGAEARAYDAALHDRARYTRLVAAALPPLGLQLLLERFADADLSSALAYRASLAAYHEQLKQQVYRGIFSARELDTFGLHELPRHRFQAKAEAQWGSGVPIWSLLVGVLLGLAGWRMARRLDRSRVSAAA